jgi:hypothetical protein
VAAGFPDAAEEVFLGIGLRPGAAQEGDGAV